MSTLSEEVALHIIIKSIEAGIQAEMSACKTSWYPPPTILLLPIKPSDTLYLYLYSNSLILVILCITVTVTSLLVKLSTAK